MAEDGRRSDLEEEYPKAKPEKFDLSGKLIRTDTRDESMGQECNQLRS